MELHGIHHVSAITANAANNYDFYTKVMGMRLVKKTVNQDDTSMYHLFYADKLGSPGTDLTFFEIHRAGRTYTGNNSISLTSLRVASDEAIRYWANRLEDYDIQSQQVELQGRKVLFFEDPEKQRLMLVSDEQNEGVSAGVPWEDADVPAEFAIIGLGPVKLTVPELAPTERVLVELMGFRKKTEAQLAGTNLHIYEVGQGGTGAEIMVEVVPDLQRERPGRGSVHHVAFRVKDRDELERAKKILYAAHLPNSGLVDRYYFQSLYFREPNGILFELATDGPGFATDEDPDALGETLALPPFLEGERESIEAKLTPLDTKKK
ncbi:ring-cleaving dioxygenase [Virgibacillus sp. 7505]|uniref:ring-cleaving dioxygenase n=1 Tax=Virgibacillus sp. 7505 TaxID=2022548 RepID=UPI000BA7DC29|nr:ring-cleaving dioxygenase [Virgibacillus sp. 7505]PAE18197.1 ring-cleaving dioxygenase [Virgibacillus sp. 7505]